MAAAADQVTAWARSVVDGKVLCGRYTLLAAKRHLRDLREGRRRGLRWDVKAADRAIRFFTKLKHSKGKWAGQPFQLSAWQGFIVGSLFGWRRADGTRRFRVAYNEIPRKNGKSTLAAGLAILLAFFDGEPGAEVYCAATKRDQAKIVWGEAKRMVMRTPALKQRIEVLTANMNVPLGAQSVAAGSKLEPLGADADSTDGLNPHGTVIDEVHAHKTDALISVLQSASGAREQPLRFEITTAGHDRTSVCRKHHEYSVQVLEGTAEDDSWFAFIAAADADDDWTKPETWAKANLNLAVSVYPGYLEAECRRATKIPAEQNTFKRLHLNVWTQQAERAIDMDVWAAGAGDVDLDALEGQRCQGGLDAADTDDLAAWALLFGPDDDGVYDLVLRFFIPQASIEVGQSKRTEELRRLLEGWVEEGHITATPGKVTDYDFIERQILDDSEAFEIVRIGYDRFGVTQLVTHLQDEFGEGEHARVQLAPIPQTTGGMGAATKQFLRLVADGKLRHNNPVLTWMVSNLSLKEDSNGNKKPDRKRSGEKIDGPCAVIMAIDGDIRTSGQQGSVYDEREPLVLGGDEDDDGAEVTE